MSPRSVRGTVAVALTGAAVLLTAPAAIAASAFVTQRPVTGGVAARAQFLAAPGEVNDVRVHQISRQRWNFVDSNNRIIAGTGCTQRGRHRVRCSPLSGGGITRVDPARVRLGNLNDQGLITGGRATLNGGSDNDTLTTAARTVLTRLLGGPGNDILAVSPDTRSGHALNGNQNNDTITGGPRGDAISGGFANDSISALGGNDAVDGDDGNDTITGGSGNDRLLGGDENDRLYGGSGNDRLRGQNGNDGLAGDSGNDRLGGGPNHDRLFGNRGGDLLVGNRGIDRFLGGPGDDALRSVDGNRERVNCGLGFDRARVDRMPRDRTAFCNVVRRVTFR